MNLKQGENLIEFRCCATEEKEEKKEKIKKNNYCLLLYYSLWHNLHSFPFLSVLKYGSLWLWNFCLLRNAIQYTISCPHLNADNCRLLPLQFSPCFLTPYLTFAFFLSFCLIQISAAAVIKNDPSKVSLKFEQHARLRILHRYFVLSREITDARVATR